MPVKVIQDDFVPKQDGNQGARLTIVGTALGKRLRLKVYRDSYDFQNSFVAETWAKNTGGLEAGWVEAIRYDALAWKLPSPYAKDDEVEFNLRVIARELARQSLELLGCADASILDAAEELAFGGPGN